MLVEAAGLRPSCMALSYPETNSLSRQIIGCAIEVHRSLGPGLLESIYEECLFWEICDSGLAVSRQRSIPIVYKTHHLAAAYRPDLVVSDKIIVEVKAVEKVLPVHDAQVLTYLKLTGLHIGLLFNFNTTSLVAGMKRISL